MVMTSEIELLSLNVFFFVSREGEEGEWSEKPITTSDNQTSFVISDLQPFTAYSFRLTAVNGIGSSEDGIASYPIITLREGERVPTPTPSSHWEKVREYWLLPHHHTERRWVNTDSYPIITLREGESTDSYPIITLRGGERVLTPPHHHTERTCDLFIPRSEDKRQHNTTLWQFEDRIH